MNILVNFLQAKTGGGKEILDNFIYQLYTNPSKHKWYILVPNKASYAHYSKKDLNVKSVGRLWKINFLFLFLYYFVLKRLIKKKKINVILNFGDVIIPSKVKQIYFFDWAYAVYNNSYIWNKMSRFGYLVRKTKVFFINKEIKKVKTVIVQTQNMFNRLNTKYGIENIKIIPTPVRINSENLNTDIEIDLPKKHKLFLVPSGYTTHKNLDVLVQVASIIDGKKKPFKIIITVNTTKESQQFIDSIKQNKLDHILINIGKQKNENMAKLYRSCDAILLPSLLESYGLPYVEAMAYGLPILTSDLDFAHDVCNDLAYYFNPFDPESIFKSMKNVFEDNQRELRIEKGKNKVFNMPTWDTIYSEFVNIISDTKIDN